MKYTLRNHSYNFTLAEDFSFEMPIAENVTTQFIHISGSVIYIYKKYAWDGSSIPGKKFLKAVTFGKYDGDRYCKEASLVHDAFYQLMRLKLLSRDHKEAIDRLYEKMCIAGAKKYINAIHVSETEKIRTSGFSNKKKSRKLLALHNRITRQLKRLPAWAARRYWAVSKFGARTLSPRYYPEKIILET